MTPTTRPPRKRDYLTMYLMIFFIVTTVGFGVAWVVQHNQNQALVAEAKQAKTQLAKWMPPDENAYQFDVTMAQRTKSSVLEFAVRERESIAKLLNNDPKADYATINTQVRSLLTEISQPSATDKDGKLKPTESQVDQPVLSVVKFLYSELVKARQDVAKANDDIAEKNKQLAANTDQRGKLEAENNKALADRDARIKAIEEEKKRFEDEKNKELADIKQSLEQKIAQLEEIERTVRTDLTQAMLTIQKKDARISSLQRKIRELRPEIDPLRLALQADGKVLNVVDNGRRVYINLGSDDRVVLGLTFEVYSAETGFTADGLGKATIEVVSLDKHTAECRVLRQAPGDPILAGDFISNVIYDKSREFAFAVLGDFDLDNDGSSALDEIEKVKAWIKTWGGRLSEQTVDGKTVPVVGESTDFVVLGAEPKRPTKPGDAADAAELEAYNRQLARYEAFQNFKAEAKALNIAVLSQNQFLNFIGQPVMQAARQAQAVDPFLRREIEAGRAAGAAAGGGAAPAPANP